MSLTSEQIQSALNAKTKPRGSLGALEMVAGQVAALQDTLRPRMRNCRLFIVAGDHGLAQEGVSAFPQAVTRQMVANFVAGGAAATVFARTFDIAVDIVDAGVAGGPTGLSGVIDARQGEGTDNARLGPAMSGAQCEAALSEGLRLGRAVKEDALCLGEMGIGNTSSASLLAHKILDLPLNMLVGRGTGLDDEGLSHKLDILSQAAARTASPLSPLDALREYGGFEIALMSGAMIGAAEMGRLVVIDGFIATSAALIAVRHNPETARALIYAHKSQEAGHGAVLTALEAKPLLDLDLRLGEGTGALLAWPLIQASVNMLCDMATFEEAGVDDDAA